MWKYLGLLEIIFLFLLFWKATVWGHKYNVKAKHLAAIIGCIYPLAVFFDPLAWHIVYDWNATIFESFLVNTPPNIAGLIGIWCGSLKKIRLERFAWSKYQALNTSMRNLVCFVTIQKMVFSQNSPNSYPFLDN